MSDTRPPSSDPAAIARWATDEIQFRTSVLVQLAELNVKLSQLTKTVADHIERDDERFGSVTQKIGDNSNWISKGTGIVIAIVAMLGFIMWIIDRVQP